MTVVGARRHGSLAKATIMGQFNKALCTLVSIVVEDGWSTTETVAVT
jgi:hypothetical protein